MDIRILNREDAQEVEALEAKKKEEREQGTSYDIDQLEKMSFFDLPEEL